MESNSSTKVESRCIIQATHQGYDAHSKIGSKNHLKPSSGFFSWFLSQTSSSSVVGRVNVNYFYSIRRQTRTYQQLNKSKTRYFQLSQCHNQLKEIENKQYKKNLDKSKVKAFSSSIIQTKWELFSCPGSSIPTLGQWTPSKRDRKSQRDIQRESERAREPQRVRESHRERVRDGQRVSLDLSLWLSDWVSPSLSLALSGSLWISLSRWLYLTLTLALSHSGSLPVFLSLSGENYNCYSPSALRN